MKIRNLSTIVFLVIFPLFATQTWAENLLNSDADYSTKIAVTINENDSIMGKLEYSNHAPQYPLQLVTFIPIGGVIHAEPYLLEVLEKTIIAKNLHRIKCRSINDKYGVGSMVIGTIDFRDELKPKVQLVNEGGYIYIGNISENGKKTQIKYMPNV